MAAAVSGMGAAFEAGQVRPLFQARGLRAVGYGYDVSPDGQRFLVNTLADQAGFDPLTVVVNWPALLRQ